MATCSQQSKSVQIELCHAHRRCRERLGRTRVGHPQSAVCRERRKACSKSRGASSLGTCHAFMHHKGKHKKTVKPPIFFDRFEPQMGEMEGLKTKSPQKSRKSVFLGVFLFSRGMAKTKQTVILQGFNHPYTVRLYVYTQWLISGGERKRRSPHATRPC